MLQKKNNQVLYGVYDIADIDALLEYKAGMVACLGRGVYLCIPAVCYRQVSIINTKNQKINEPVAKTDSCTMS